jgi:hypothetical protein
MVSEDSTSRVIVLPVRLQRSVRRRIVKTARDHLRLDKNLHAEERTLWSVQRKTMESLTKARADVCVKSNEYLRFLLAWSAFSMMVRALHLHYPTPPARPIIRDFLNDMDSDEDMRMEEDEPLALRSFGKGKSKATEAFAYEDDNLPWSESAFIRFRMLRRPTGWKNTVQSH